MKVSVVRGGGLAPFVTTTAVRSESLSPEHAEELRARIDRAGVFDLAAEAPPGPTGPDQFSYALTVEDEDRKHTVVLSEAALSEEVRSLISWIGSVPGHERHVRPSG